MLDYSTFTKFKKRLDSLFSKSHGVRREYMPQIVRKHHGDFAKFVKDKFGGNSRPMRVKATSLKPTQGEYNMDKVVKKYSERQDNPKNILVSNDNYVLDGHHAYAAQYLHGDIVNVLKFDLDIKTLLAAAKAYPNTVYAGINESVTEIINENITRYFEMSIGKTEVFKNIPMRMIPRFISSSNFNEVRAILLKNGDMLYWDAAFLTHETFKARSGIKNIDAHMTFYEDSVEVYRDSSMTDVTPAILKKVEKALKGLSGYEISGAGKTIYLEQTEIHEAEYQGRKVTLNEPFRTPDGPKKFSVYVKNDSGNVIKVNFGDPNMEIKRDDPERRKSFRARHNCDDPGPKTKARYWSCKNW